MARSRAIGASMADGLAQFLFSLDTLAENYKSDEEEVAEALSKQLQSFAERLNNEDYWDKVILAASERYLKLLPENRRHRARREAA